MNTILNVIFDLDGTIINSVHITGCIKFVLYEKGLSAN